MHCHHIKLPLNTCILKYTYTLNVCAANSTTYCSGVPRNFVRGGVPTNSVEDRENGDLGAIAPWLGVLEAAVIWYKKFHFI
jgi:hypothetical protein